MKKFSPAFAPSPRDSLDDILWPQDLMAQHDFFDGPIEARPGNEVIGHKATWALGSLTTAGAAQTPEHLTEKTVEFADLLTTVATGGVGARIHQRHEAIMHVSSPQLTVVTNMEDLHVGGKPDFDTPQIPDDGSFEQYTLPAAA